MQYYIIYNGSQMGPYSKDELRIQGLTPETMVWRQGMEGWAPASSLPELTDIWSESYTEKISEPQPAPSMNPPYPQNSGYNAFNNLNNSNGVPAPHTNWLPWAIVGTVLGFCTSCIGGILGIIAIVKANSANNFYRMGMFQQAEQANSSAKTLTIITLVLDALGIIGSISYFAFIYPTVLSYV